ncbi:hypothetical protein ACSQ67_008442 [Phaseolus vulgaris]
MLPPMPQHEEVMPSSFNSARANDSYIVVDRSNPTGSHPIRDLTRVDPKVTSPQNHLESLGSNLRKEDTECLEWLKSKEPNFVVYVNFGSITIMSPEKLSEFAWGLVNSKRPFYGSLGLTL